MLGNNSKYQLAGSCELYSTDDCSLNKSGSRCKRVGSGQGDKHCICSEYGICVKMTTVQGLRAQIRRVERQLKREKALQRLREKNSTRR